MIKEDYSMKQLIIRNLVIFLIMVYGSNAFSQDIKARMIERLPVIKELKAKGVIGEDNKGYLQFVGPAKEKEDIIRAENEDRQKVYESIASQQGVTVDIVGVHRAKQIHEKAAQGEWLQDASGKWYQK